MPKVVMNMPELALSFDCCCQDCEDKCCNWFETIYFSQKVYETLQKSPDEKLKQGAEALKLNELANTKYDYAFLKPNGACPFLTKDARCQIENSLGQKLMGHPCKTYPKVYFNMGDGLEIGLAPGCPQVLELAAKEKKPLKFIKMQRELGDDITSNNYTDIYNRYSGFALKLRQLAINLLQNRNFSIPQRLLLMEALFNHLDSLFDNQEHKRGEFLEMYCKGISDQACNTLLANFKTSLKNQLVCCSILSEPMLGFAKDDFVNEILKFAGEFFKGVNTDSPEMDELVEKYNAAQKTYYEPFIEKYGYFIENLLVLEAFSYGMPLLQFKSMCDSVLFLSVYFAMIRFLICLQSLKTSAEVTLDEAKKIAQGVAKRFEATRYHYDDGYNGVLTRTKLIYVFAILKKLDFYPITLVNGLLGDTTQGQEEGGKTKPE